MIKTRPEILKINQVLTEHIVSIQKVKYGTEIEYLKGEKVFDEDFGGSIILTKELADKLNCEAQNSFLKNRDRLPFSKYLSQNWIGGIKMISSQNEIGSYFKDISTFLQNLFDTKLLVIADWSTPWLRQENNYPPVKAATEFFKKQISPDFIGGFELTSEEIPKFIPHLFWLTRCNASLPEFLMSFENSKTILSICKYGILHFEFYDKEERINILKHCADKKFDEVIHCQDPINFDSFIGRKLNLVD